MDFVTWEILTLVLVFDVWSDLAMFRNHIQLHLRYHSHFHLQLLLIMSAIGIRTRGRKEASNAYWGSAAESQIGIGFINRIQYYSTTINLLKFKSRNGDMGEHIQSKHQMLKTPRFRIYFQGGQLYSQLKTFREQGVRIYSLSGSSVCPG